jgi:hypothetical protein
MAERFTRAQVERKAEWLNKQFGFDFNIRVNGAGGLVIESSNEAVHNLGGSARECIQYLMGVQYAAETMHARLTRTIASAKALNELTNITYAEPCDVHRKTAAAYFGVSEEAVTLEQRAFAKRLSFAALYGRSVQKLGEETP